MKWLKGSILFIVLTFGLVACSTSESAFSPEEIVQQAIAEGDKALTYYGEAVLTVEDIAFTDTVEIKEWQSKEGKRRIETISKINPEKATAIYDGLQLISYDEVTNTAYIFDMSGEEMIGQLSPREQAELLLESIKDTHTVTLVGEEKLLDRDVYHIKAEVNIENSLYADQEIWIDKENWFVLKSISDGGDTKVTIEYIKIDFAPTIDDSLFELDLPDDAIIKNLEDTLQEIEVESLEEGLAIVGKPFLYVEEKDGLTIEQISTITIEGVSSEITLNYYKDFEPYFTLSMLAIDEENIPYAGEGINIRGMKGEHIGIEDFHFITWAEDGIGYNVSIDNPGLTVDEMMEMIENMIYFGK